MAVEDEVMFTLSLAELQTDYQSVGVPQVGLLWREHRFIYTGAFTSYSPYI